MGWCRSAGGVDLERHWKESEYKKEYYERHWVVDSYTRKRCLVPVPKLPKYHNEYGFMVCPECGSWNTHVASSWDPIFRCSKCENRFSANEPKTYMEQVLFEKIEALEARIKELEDE